MADDSHGNDWGGLNDTRPTPVPAPRPLLAAAPDPRGGELLGQGGMGQVRLVDDPRLGRRVALKVMHAEVAATEDGRNRFLREARVQGQLEHPAIVPVYELGESEDGVPWFTMKRVRGVTLEMVLAGLEVGDEDVKARFPRRRLLTAFVQVCLAIDFAHSRAVLHRDLKPGNIMLGDFGDVHVLDWGLAQFGQERGPARDLVQALEDASRGGSVFGTPGYMSPEQIHGNPVDARTDVYALGAILFELLTLLPMNPGTPGARIANTLKGEGRSPSLAAPRENIPPELDALVLAATEPDPARRLGSARALAEGVERFLDGDRDVELRRSLAARHVAAAGPLVESLDANDLETRGTAMSHLTGALALEPGNAEALALLRRLVTHVPETLPPAVEQARQQSAGVARAGLARVVAFRMGMWLALAPMVWAMSPVSVPLGGAVVVAVLVAAFISMRAGRRTSLSGRGLALVMAATGVVLLGLVLLFGSFLLVPTMVSTVLVMFASELKPKARAATIAAGLGIVLVPFILEQLGVIPPGYDFSHKQIRVLPRLVHFPPELTKLFLGIATMSTLALPGILAGQLRDKLANAEKRLFMMAWHLEALGRRGA